MKNETITLSPIVELMMTREKSLKELQTSFLDQFQNQASIANSFGKTNRLDDDEHGVIAC
jgi:hypothetical protein